MMFVSDSPGYACFTYKPKTVKEGKDALIYCSQRSSMLLYVIIFIISRVLQLLQIPAT